MLASLTIESTQRVAGDMVVGRSTDTARGETDVAKPRFRNGSGAWPPRRPTRPANGCSWHDRRTGSFLVHGKKL